jgi:hypothetical protein
MQMKNFVVASVGCHPNSFGLTGIVLMARDGEAWHAENEEPQVSRGDVVGIEVDEGGVLRFDLHGLEHPVKMHDANARVVTEVWRYVRDETDPKQQQAHLAIMAAKRRVTSCGFGDLFSNGFSVMTYTDADLVASGGNRDWCGNYVSGSIDSILGLTAGLNVDLHDTYEDMADTICHEIGHSLYELLDAESQAEWIAAAEDAEWGPTEAFADEFMHLTRGDRHLMEYPAVFERIVAPEQHQ